MRALRAAARTTAFLVLAHASAALAAAPSCPDAKMPLLQKEEERRLATVAAQQKEIDGYGPQSGNPRTCGTPVTQEEVRAVYQRLMAEAHLGELPAHVIQELAMCGADYKTQFKYWTAVCGMFTPPGWPISTGCYLCGTKSHNVCFEHYAQCWRNQVSIDRCVPPALEVDGKDTDTRDPAEVLRRASYGGSWQGMPTVHVDRNDPQRLAIAAVELCAREDYFSRARGSSEYAGCNRDVLYVAIMNRIVWEKCTADEALGASCDGNKAWKQLLCTYTTLPDFMRAMGGTMYDFTWKNPPPSAGSASAPPKDSKSAKTAGADPSRGAAHTGSRTSPGAGGRGSTPPLSPPNRQGALPGPATHETSGSTCNALVCSDGSLQLKNYGNSPPSASCADEQAGQPCSPGQECLLDAPVDCP